MSKTTKVDPNQHYKSHQAIENNKLLLKSKFYIFKVFEQQIA
jgi:hypothetical protein